MIYTVNKYGTPGHPTRKENMADRLIRRKRARLHGGGASGKPPVLVFLDRVFDPARRVDRAYFIAP